MLTLIRSQIHKQILDANPEGCNQDVLNQWFDQGLRYLPHNGNDRGEDSDDGNDVNDDNDCDDGGERPATKPSSIQRAGGQSEPSLSPETWAHDRTFPNAIGDHVKGGGALDQDTDRIPRDVGKKNLATFLAVAGLIISKG